MSRAVLDASAILALILDETGADMVESHLDGAVVSAVNLAEVGAKMLERGSSLEAVDAELRAAGIEVVPFDEAQALEAARLRPLTRAWGLSLGDRACLALGGLTGSPVLTTDREWAETGLPLDIRLIR
jgi:PIN domain nuclease of toxin-antitoxin system